MKIYEGFKSLKVFSRSTFLDFAKDRELCALFDERDSIGANGSLIRIAPLFDAVKGKIQSNVYMPTHSYVEAVYKSTPAFRKSFLKGDIEKLLCDSFGCILTNSGLVYYYAYTHEFQFVLVMLDRFIVCAHWQKLDGTDDKTYDLFWFITKNEGFLKKMGVDGMSAEEATGFMCSLPVWYVMMEKYATVENVTIGAGRKYVTTNKADKIVNTTGVDVSRRDCSWFTEICRNEGFMVAGHFRLQPYKDGVKRLIYIEPFEKHGYHRKAKIQEVCM